MEVPFSKRKKISRESVDTILELTGNELLADLVVEALPIAEEDVGFAEEALLDAKVVLKLAKESVSTRITTKNRTRKALSVIKELK